MSMTLNERSRSELGELMLEMFLLSPGDFWRFDLPFATSHSVSLEKLSEPCGDDFEDLGKIRGSKAAKTSCSKSQIDLRCREFIITDVETEEMNTNQALKTSDGDQHRISCIWMQGSSAENLYHHLPSWLASRSS